MNDVLRHWNLSGEMPVQIDTFHKSAWLVGERYILKRNANADELSRSIRLAGLLVSEGLPAAEYIKTVGGQFTTPDGTYCLMKRIRGGHVDFFAQPDMITELGRGLARLHMALARIEAEVGDNDFLAEWHGYIKPGIAGVSGEIAEYVEARLSELYEKLPRQPIHRDVHAQNVLFYNGRISGWLDFDLNRRDARIFDLAYLLAGLICGKTDNPAMVGIWKTLCKNLLSGYDEVNPVTGDEREALPVMMIAIELLFVAFWNCGGNIEERRKAAGLAEWLYNEYGNQRD